MQLSPVVAIDTRFRCRLYASVVLPEGYSHINNTEERSITITDHFGFLFLVTDTPIRIYKMSPSNGAIVGTYVQQNCK
jgi:hypothetical protein